MFKLKQSIAIATAVLSGALSFSIQAAQDGALGNPSIGSTIISITKDDAVMISNVDDINFGVHSALISDISGGDEVCVYSSTEKYVVTATTPTGAFNFNGPAPLPFSVMWNGEVLKHGLPSQTNAGDSFSFNCNGSANVALEASVAAADFNISPAGFYSEVVTLTVEPI